MGAYCFPAGYSSEEAEPGEMPTNSFFADLRNAGYTLVFYQANLTGPPFLDTQNDYGVDLDGHPRYRGLRIETPGSDAEVDDPKRTMYEQFLTLIDAIQSCFDDIEANGLKVIFTINYDNVSVRPPSGDIDARALIDDSEGLLGQNHVDAFGEWLFNAHCQGSRDEVMGNPECVYQEDDGAIHVRRDFTHIHTIFVAGFIGWRVQSSGGRNRVSERSEQYAVLPSRRRAGA